MNNATPEQITFAHEIADTLRDPEAYPLYLSYVQRYQEAFLRKILTRVMSISDHKIRRTRGALFTFLVNQHGNSPGAWN